MYPVMFSAGLTTRNAANRPVAFGKGTVKEDSLALGGIRVNLDGSDLPEKEIEQALNWLNKVSKKRAEKIKGKLPDNTYLEFCLVPNSQKIALLICNPPDGGATYIAGTADRNENAIKGLLIKSLDFLNIQAAHHPK
jgi:hypothetical protein